MEPGTRIVIVANADHFVAIAEFVSQCAPTFLLTIENRFWCGSVRFKSARDGLAAAIGYAMHRSRSHDAVICVYDDAGDVIETHEHKGDFKRC